MALLAPTRATSRQYQQYQRNGFVAAGSMEGNEELEEGEARETSELNYGPDLNFPHLEIKLTEVLGHMRKEFEGEVCAEKLGSKYGGYGTFLPTESRVPTLAAGPAAPPPRQTAVPAASRRPSPPKHQAAPVPRAAAEAAKGTAPVARNAYSITVSPNKQSKAESSGEAKKTNSITLRFKMGSDGTSRGKNSAIYNGLGFSSPSVSEEDDDENNNEDDEAETSPERSPASVLQFMLSAHPAGLLSPLSDLLASKKEEPLPLKKEEPLKERRQIKIVRKAKDHFDNAMDLDQDSKQSKPENAPRSRKSKVINDEGHSSFQRDAKKIDSKDLRHHETLDTGDERTAGRSRRDEPDQSVEKPYPEKRKSKDTTNLERPKKKQKSNSSSGSFDMEEKKSRKPLVLPVAEANVPYAQEFIAKPKDPIKEKVSKAHSKTTQGKSKTTTSKNKVEPPVAAAGFDIKMVEPEVPAAGTAPVLIPEEWVECVKCKTWRLLPPSMSANALPKKWLCKMIDWLPDMNDCKFTEQETTEAVRRYFLPLPPPDLVPAPAPPAGANAVSPLKQPSISRKGPAEMDLYPEGNINKVKIAKHAPKRKEKSKLEGDLGINDKDRLDKSKKKKTAISRVSKKPKLDDSQSSRCARPESSNELNVFGVEVEPVDRAAKKVSSRDYLSSKTEDRKLDRKAQGFDGTQGVRAENMEREEQVDMRKSLEGLSKPSKADKSSKGKAIRVVASGDTGHPPADLDGKAQKGNDEEHYGDTRRKKAAGNRSPRGLSPCTSSDGYKARLHGDSTTARGYDRKEADYRHSNGIKDWEENDHLWDDQPEQPKQVSRHYEDRDRDRHEGKTREEKLPSKHSKGAEGRSHHESSDDAKGRLKHEVVDEQCRYDKGDRRDGKSERDASDKKRAPDKDAAVKGSGAGDAEDSNDDRKGPADQQEGGTVERKDLALANIAIKNGTNLKHTADRLKDGATDIYLQAALKFLEGAALMNRTQLYVDTAELFRFCAGNYERAKDTVGAMLARKCAAVACFRVLMLRNSTMSKDRADLQAVLPRAPAVNQTTPPPPTGESPSSSSASDLDNLNNQTMPLDKANAASGKGGAVSPMRQGAGSGSYMVPATLQPALDRFIRGTSDVFEAFDDWNKADSLQATLLASKTLSPDVTATVEKVGSIGFSDVQNLVRLVNQVLGALGR